MSNLYVTVEGKGGTSLGQLVLEVVALADRLGIDVLLSFNGCYLHFYPDDTIKEAIDRTTHEYEAFCSRIHCN